MNLKGIISKIILINIIMIIFLSVNYTVRADMLGNMQNQADTFISTGKNQSGNIDWKSVTGEFVELGQILTMIGAGVLVAVIGYMGIKYLTSGPEAQAKLKVQLIGVIVSAIVILSAYNIWKIVINIASEF